MKLAVVGFTILAIVGLAISAVVIFNMIAGLVTQDWMRAIAWGVALIALRIGVEIGRD